jgi:serine/threonine protein kinase
MPLSPGERLGPYEILSAIGAGGMGEVFRATDTRLHRTVAIKVLPHDKIGDPNCKLRFLQEARAASALNHPNIVTLHDIARENSLDYLVMEYVPGKSLDKLITPKVCRWQRHSAWRRRSRARWRRRTRLESCIGISSRGT